MLIGGCSNCKYLDLIESDVDTICPRCSGRMISFGINSSEWNDLSDADKKAIVDDTIPANDSCRETINNEAKPNNDSNEPESKLSHKQDKAKNDTYQNINTSQNNKRIQASQRTPDSSAQKAKRVSAVQSPTNNDQKKADNEDRFSKLSIAAFALSLLGVSSIAGLILGIIDLTKKDGRKRGLSIAAVVIGGIALLTSILFLILQLVGGGPERVVNKFNDGMKSFDAVKINECLINPSEDVSDVLESNDEELDVFTSYIIEQAKSIKCNIVNSEINGDDATVYVKYTYTDASTVLISTLGEAISQAFALAFTGGSNDQMDDIMLEIFNRKTQEDTLGTAEVTLPIQCKKVGGEWKISELPEDIVNVLTCNMIKGFEDFGSSLNESEGDKSNEDSLEEVTRDGSSTENGDNNENYSEDLSEDTSEDEESEITLDDTYNWYVGDIWNPITDFRDYIIDGTDSTGSAFDADFAYDDYKIAIAKRDDYTRYIHENHLDISSTWDKMMEQLDIINANLEDGYETGSEEIDTSLLSQYSEKFYDYYYENI